MGMAFVHLKDHHWAVLLAVLLLTAARLGTTARDMRLPLFLDIVM
jgi:hypothetical protein